MAYKLERQKRLQKELQIGEEIIKVDIVPEAIARDFYRCQASILALQVKIKDVAGDAAALEPLYQELGTAIIEMMRMVFGQANTEKIIAFYEGNYQEMVMMVSPYIEDEIVPALHMAVEAERERIRARYANKRPRK